MINGLSHYSLKFSEALTKKGHHVEVGCLDGLGGNTNFKIHPLSSVGFFEFLSLFFKLRRNSPDIFLIEFVPTMYGKRGGINFSLSFLALWLRLFSGIKIHVMFHELHYPLEANFKAIILWFSHHIIYLSLVLLSHKSFFSTVRFLKEAKRFFSYKKCFHLPVGSNIERALPNSGEKEKKNYHFCFFAGAHPSKRFHPIFEGLYGFKNQVHLSFIGIEEGDFQKVYGSEYLEFSTKFLGKIDDDKIGELFHDCDALIAFFTDGLSTRRGSVLAALNNGLSVISTASKYTDPIFFNFPGVFLFDHNESIFPSELTSLLLEGKGLRLHKDGKAEIMKAFDEYFSWSSIVEKYLAHT